MIDSHFCMSPDEHFTWQPSEYVWDDLRLVAGPSDAMCRGKEKKPGLNTRSNGSDAAYGNELSRRAGRGPATVKPPLVVRACRIEGCTGICNSAYTARSRVCLAHMKAGGGAVAVELLAPPRLADNSNTAKPPARPTFALQSTVFFLEKARFVFPLRRRAFVPEQKYTYVYSLTRYSIPFNLEFDSKIGGVT
jgi:hypothetical protein